MINKAFASHTTHLFPQNSSIVFKAVRDAYKDASSLRASCENDVLHDEKRRRSSYRVRDDYGKLVWDPGPFTSVLLAIQN